MEDGPVASIDILNRCIPLFEALKDPHRQAIVVRLVAEGPLTVNDIADASSLSRTAISHHLKILEQTGLVSVHKIATRRLCTANTDLALNLLRQLASALEADLAAAAECRTERGAGGLTA